MKTTYLSNLIIHHTRSNYSRDKLSPVSALLSWLRARGAWLTLAAVCCCQLLAGAATAGAELVASNSNRCVGCAQFLDQSCLASNYTLFSECNCGGGGSCCAGRAKSACCGVVPHSSGCNSSRRVV